MKKKACMCLCEQYIYIIKYPTMIAKSTTPLNELTKRKNSGSSNKFVEKVHYAKREREERERARECESRVDEIHADYKIDSPTPTTSRIEQT